eukprot:scaffold3369_cov188-Prasinococcus_capsulatus_cf.AAC.1
MAERQAGSALGSADSSVTHPGGRDASRTERGHVRARTAVRSRRAASSPGPSPRHAPGALPLRVPARAPAPCAVLRANTRAHRPRCGMGDGQRSVHSSPGSASRRVLRGEERSGARPHPPQRPQRTSSRDEGLARALSARVRNVWRSEGCRTGLAVENLTTVAGAGSSYTAACGGGTAGRAELAAS